MQHTLHFPDLRNLKTNHRKGAVSNFEYSGGNKHSRVGITDGSTKVEHGRYEVKAIHGTSLQSSCILLSYCIRRQKVWQRFNETCCHHLLPWRNKPADSSETMMTSYHSAWRHNPTEAPSPPSCEVFRNNAWHLWESCDTAPLINLS
jgi:hypothetical protein